MRTQKLLFALSFLFVCLSANTVSAQLTSANMYQLSAEPIIDGQADALWAGLPINLVNYQNATTTRTPDADYGVTYRMGWRNNKLFFLVNVTDNVRVFDATANRWEIDYVSFYLNLSANFLTQTSFYGNSDPHWNIRVNIREDGAPVSVSGRGGASSEATGWGWPTGIANFPAMEIATKEITGGYYLELAIDLSNAGWNFNQTLTDGLKFGLDVEGNDVDVHPTRNHQLFWSNGGNGQNAWQNLSGVGEVTVRSAGPISSAKNIDKNSPIAFVSNNVLQFKNLENVNEIVINSISGQVIKTIKLNNQSANNVSGLKAGVYFVTFKAEKATTQKIIVK